MNKKVMIGLIVLILVLLGTCVYFMIESNKNNTGNNLNEIPNVNIGDSNTLVVYFSATGSTKRVALEIANNINADTFEITPKEKYTSEDLNYNNSNSRVSKEHNDESLRNVELEETTVPNWDDYDTVLIGYPIWWGIAAWPVDSFVKANNFDGKTVIPFCTSASSSLGDSDKLLKNISNKGNWQEGHRFSSSVSSSDIKSWTDSLK